MFTLPIASNGIQPLVSGDCIEGLVCGRTCFRVPIIQDVVFESLEQFTLTASLGASTTASINTVVFIQDDDGEGIILLLVVINCHCLP